MAGGATDRAVEGDPRVEIELASQLVLPLGQGVRRRDIHLGGQRIQPGGDRDGQRFVLDQLRLGRQPEIFGGVGPSVDSPPWTSSLTTSVSCLVSTRWVGVGLLRLGPASPAPSRPASAWPTGPSAGDRRPDWRTRLRFAPSCSPRRRSATRRREPMPSTIETSGPYTSSVESLEIAAILDARPCAVRAPDDHRRLNASDQGALSIRRYRLGPRSDRDVLTRRDPRIGGECCRPARRREVISSWRPGPRRSAVPPRPGCPSAARHSAAGHP